MSANGNSLPMSQSMGMRPIYQQGQGAPSYGQVNPMGNSTFSLDDWYNLSISGSQPMSRRPMYQPGQAASSHGQANPLSSSHSRYSVPNPSQMDFASHPRHAAVLGRNQQFPTHPQNATRPFGTDNEPTSYDSTVFANPSVSGRMKSTTGRRQGSAPNAVNCPALAQAEVPSNQMTFNGSEITTRGNYSQPITPGMQAQGNKSQFYGLYGNQGPASTPYGKQSSKDNNHLYTANQLEGYGNNGHGSLALSYGIIPGRGALSDLTDNDWPQTPLHHGDYHGGFESPSEMPYDGQQADYGPAHLAHPQQVQMPDVPNSNSYLLHQHQAPADYMEPVATNTAPGQAQDNVQEQHEGNEAAVPHHEANNPAVLALANCRIRATTGVEICRGKTMYCIEFCARKMPRTEIRVLPRTRGANYISKRRSNDPCQLLNPIYPPNCTGHLLFRKLANKVIYSLLHPRFSIRL